MGRGFTRVVMGGGDVNGLQNIYILFCKELVLKACSIYS